MTLGIKPTWGKLQKRNPALDVRLPFLVSLGYWISPAVFPFFFHYQLYTPQEYRSWGESHERRTPALFTQFH